MNKNRGNKFLIVMVIITVVVAAAVVVGVIFLRNSNQTDNGKTKPSESETTISETTKKAEPEKDTINENEKDLYKMIGTSGADIPDTVSYDANPCADGGLLLNVNVVGYYASTHEIDEASYEIKGSIKTLYIMGYNHHIINGLNTGRDYEYYTDRVDDISSLEYDSSSFAYSCSFKETINNNPVTIWIFFNSPDGKSTGAIISTEKLKGKYSGRLKSENNVFLLNQGGLPLSEMKVNMPSLFNDEIVFADIYSRVGKNVNVCLGKQYGDEKDIDDYNNESISSFTLGCDPAEYSDNIEILPGVKIGDNYDSIVSKGYTFFGELSESEMYGGNMCIFTFRVGAVNYECYVSFDENENLVCCSNLLIKPLCS